MNIYTRHKFVNFYTKDFMCFLLKIKSLDFRRIWIRFRIAWQSWL